MKTRNPTTLRRNKAFKKGSLAYKERRRQIAEVAAGLFNRLGFRGTSLAAIAKELGTDRASIYYYVADKNELFDELVGKVAEAHVVEAESVLAQEGTPLEKLRTLLIGLMSSYAQHYPLLYVHMRENLAHAEKKRSAWSARMREVNRRYENVFIKLLTDGIADGTIRPLAPPKILAFGIMGIVNWTNRWYVPQKTPESPELIGSAYAELVVAGLAAKPKAPKTAPKRKPARR